MRGLLLLLLALALALALLASPAVGRESAAAPAALFVPTLAAEASPAGAAHDDFIEPLYADDMDQQDALLETGAQESPRMLHAAQFRSYFRSVTSDPALGDRRALLEASAGAAGTMQARMATCKVLLNSWLHKCVY